MQEELTLFSTPRDTPNEIPYGYCHCGCGNKAPIATYTNKRRRVVKGQQLRFISGHNTTVKTSPPDDLFWKHVDKKSDDECWEWTACRHKKGYGMFGTDLKHCGNKAHRAAWILTHGPITDGLHVCHSCDNPPCCNPKHLFLGTNLDNVRDKVAKGRAKGHPGELNNNSKLTRQDIIEIRDLHAHRIFPNTVIASLYGILPLHVWQIGARRSWKHIP
jgi:hypothetical protein